MDDVIRRDDILKRLYKLRTRTQQRKDSVYRTGEITALDYAINEVQDCKAVEMAAVVRCERCTHATERDKTMIFCTIHNRTRMAGDFCNHGEDFLG